MTIIILDYVAPDRWSCIDIQLCIVFKHHRLVHKWQLPVHVPLIQSIIYCLSIRVAQWALPPSVIHRWRHWGSSSRNFKAGEGEVGGEEEMVEEVAWEMAQVQGEAVGLRPPAAAAWQPWSTRSGRHWRSCRGNMSARWRRWKMRRTGCCWRRPRTPHEVSTSHCQQRNRTPQHQMKSSFEAKTLSRPSVRCCLRSPF